MENSNQEVEFGKPIKEAYQNFEYSVEHTAEDIGLTLGTFGELVKTTAGELWKIISSSSFVFGFILGGAIAFGVFGFSLAQIKENDDEGSVDESDID